MKRRLLKWIGRAGAAVIVLVALAIGVLATSAGQNLALGLGAYLASDQDSKVEIGALQGSLFGAGRIDRVVLSDRDGPWLDIRDIQLAWHPIELFLGRVAIDELIVASVRVVRTPVAGSEAPDEGVSGGLTLIPVRARRVEVTELTLDEPVVGKAVSLRIAASADLVDASQDLAAQIAIERLDEPGAELHATFGYRAEGDDVDVRVEGREPADGLVAHVLDFPQRPPLAITFSGSGPRARWRGNWALSASGKAFAAGNVAVDDVEGGHTLAARFEGYLGHILPDALKGVLDGKTTGALSAFWAGHERFDVREVSLSSAALQFSAAGVLDLDRSALSGRATVRLARDDGQPVRVALAPDDVVTIERLAVEVSLPDALQRVARADITASGMTSPFGTAASVRLAASASQAHAQGRSAFDADKIDVTATIEGLAPPDAAATEEPGASAHLAMTGHSSAGVLTIAALKLEAAGSTVAAKGTVEDGRFVGTAALRATDLARFSALAGRTLAGALGVNVAIDTGLSGDELALEVKASGSDLSLGLGSADELFAGTTQVDGRVSQTPAGELRIDDVRLKTAAVEALISGRAGRKKIALDADVEVRDLSKAAPSLAGAATLKIAVSGARDDLVSNVVVGGTNVRVHGARLEAPKLSFAGRGPLGAHAGKFALTGALDGQPIDGTGSIAFGEDVGLVVEQVSVGVASARLKGNMRVPTEGNPQGRFVVALPRLADFAAIAGTPLQGSANAEIEFAEADGVPSLRVRADAPALRAGETKIRGLAIATRIADYRRALRIEGKAQLAALDSAQLQVRDLQLDAAPADAGTLFQAGGIINEFSAALSGRAEQRDSLYAIALSSMSLKKDGLSAVVDQSADIEIDGDSVKIDRLVIKTENGRTEVGGTVSPAAIDLAVTLKRLPAALANAFDRTLGLEGHVDGTVAVGGTTASPKADATLSWSGASAQVLRAQSLPALEIDARAHFADNAVAGEVEVGGVEGFAVKANGRASLASKGTMKAQLAGTVPLSIANGVLGERAASADGTARVEATVTGALDAPKVSGTVRIDSASLNDPASGLKLVAITGSARFTQDGVIIEQLQGTSARGGTFAANGSVTRGGGTMAADLRLNVVGLKFDDQQLMSGELDANLSVKGPFDDLLARGTVGLKRLDVIVPSQMPQSITSLEIKHVNAPAGSRAARTSEKPEEQSSPPIRGRLNVQIDAANRIFVRGRGLDAQLGGSLLIRGTTNAPVADGAFVMQRGRLTIVGRQLDFKHGRIYFNGSLDPQLDMEAAAEADDHTISVLITGPAAKPRFKFTSDPALPEDEAMARLLFNKSLAKLSPVQLAQLASEVDKIGGLSSGPSTLDKLKSAVGVDVLDVSTDEGNDPTVSAGSYVDENTYVGVRQGTTASSSRVVIDHDFTKSLKARGELGADGNSKIGVGVEWDY